MFKCTGICSTCGKCQSETIINSTNNRKTKMIEYPSDFIAEKKEGYGVAFDIGTTTIVGILRDLDTGNQIGTKAKTNPQNEYGMDVISRITFCGEDEGNLDILRDKTLDALNQIIKELAEDNDIEESQINSVVICGNTTMSHIIAGYSPISLAHAPFDPAYTGTVSVNGEESLLNINHHANVTILPSIAGHVGGDITSGIIATRFLLEKGLTVFIDIGTNGEIVITDGKSAYACSTAAGPAFEGAAIQFGMRATHGAIEKAEIRDGEVFFKTIGSCEPMGICGSGLIDIIAQMKKNGLIEKTGRLISPEKAIEKGIPPELVGRLETDGTAKHFVLVYKENSENIVITQNDIREVQLAKGAIAAGIEILLNELDKTVNDIEKVVVAGAFGNYIDKESAVEIGILPNINLEKIQFAGNAAGAGVSMALANDNELKSAEVVPDKVSHIELASREEFQNIYLKAMSFKS